MKARPLGRTLARLLYYDGGAHGSRLVDTRRAIDKRHQPNASVRVHAFQGDGPENAFAQAIK